MSKKIIVLIVDRSENERGFMRELLEKENKQYEIIEAETGEEVMEELDEMKPHVIILDAHSSGMDGFEICRKIKKEQKSPPKIIIRTGMIDALEIGKARDVGADDYCAKAADGASLIQAIKNLV